MYSVTDVNDLFESSSDVTVYQHDDDQYVEENALNREGSDISEILSFGSSPIAADIETVNRAHNAESSKRRENGLRSIYEIRILHKHNTLSRVSALLKLLHFTTILIIILYMQLLFKNYFQICK
jgi:hypothetical protein